MTLVSTAISSVLRGISISARIYAPSLSVPVLRRTFASDRKQNQEVEDVLYKRCEIECRSVDPAVLSSYSRFAQQAARELGITIGECHTPRKANKKRWTMLKSRFVHVKHQVQYEVRTYFHVMNFLHLTGSTADTFLEYVERNLPEGVALKVTKVRLERLPEHLKSPPDVSLPEEGEEDTQSQHQQKNA